MGFELIVNNYSVGIIGAIIAVIGCVWLGPAIASLTGVFAAGVDFLVQNNLLPLTAILIEPAKPLFLNNAIGQVLLAKKMGKTRVIAETGARCSWKAWANPSCSCSNPTPAPAWACCSLTCSSARVLPSPPRGALPSSTCSAASMRYTSRSC